MILRKPYAFLIKKFRLIHLLLSFIVAYLIYNTSDILKVYNTYISSKQVSDVSNAIGNLSRPLMYIALFVFIVSILTVAIVLKVKQKPIFMYIVNIIITVAVIGLYSYAFSTLNILLKASVDIRLIRVLRDLLIIAIALQSIQFIMLFVRATGFDIKKFDFGSDLIGLEVTEEDREEVEVSLELDSDASKRKIINFLRNFRYTFLENKFIFSILILIIVIIITSIIFYRVVNKPHAYKEGELFSTNNYTMKVNSSYLTDKDYYGKVINDDYAFLIIDIDAKTFYKDTKINYGNMYILINNTKYFGKLEYNKYFSDLENVYNDQSLSTTEFKNYAIIFAIPKDTIDNSKKLVFENEQGTTEVKITAKKEDGAKDLGTFEIGSEVEIEDENIFLYVDEIELSKEFFETYETCSNECYSGFHYVVANSLKNYETTLLKLDVTFDSQKNSFEKFLKYYGSLKYKIGNAEYNSEIIFKESKDDETYLEVNSNINQADTIYFEINTRNSKFIYKLK